MRPKVERRNPLQWILEALEAEPSFFQKPMFGCEAAYLFGRLMFVLAAQDEPWKGVLVCTSHEFHSVLLREYPDLRPHPVLGKWLYLPHGHESFEETAEQLVGLVIKNDPRIGVEPRERKAKRQSSRRKA